MNTISKSEIHSIEELIEKIVEADKNYNTQKIRTAFEFADKAHGDQKRSSGEPYIVHPLSVSGILVELGMDTDTICAALLHDVIEDTEYSFDDIKETFGETVAMLVESVTKITRMPYFNEKEQQAKNFMKILLAMSHDIRVIIIKLADRLHNIRTLDFLPQKKKLRIAEETLKIYAPMARQMGMYALYDEMVDTAFKHMDWFAYSEVEHMMHLKKEKREEFIETIIARLHKELEKCNFKEKPEIYGRVKSIYGIYNKVYKKHKQIEEVFDKYAVRVIVNDINECYSVLGVVHNIFSPFVDRFKDYIAVPKSNGYRSLHTTVMSRESIPFEVQIRTKEMHASAEYGVAAHWKYKEGIQKTDDLVERMEWVRTMNENQQESDDVEEIVSVLNEDIAKEEIVVLSPKADYYPLPKGATPLDFAYRIHTNVGHSAVGAIVNGRIVPLDYELKTGEVCNILRSKDPNKGPSREWLKIVVTNHARTKIRTWLKKECREENIMRGKTSIEQELRRLRIVVSAEEMDEFLNDMVRKYLSPSLDDFYASIGYGGISMQKMTARLIERFNKRIDKTESAEEGFVPITAPVKNTGSNCITIDKIDDVVYKLAKCCSPVPGDDIIGFITRGHGISIHSKNCVNYVSAVKRNAPEDMERWMEVRWTDNAQPVKLSTNIEVMAVDRVGLLFDVARVISESHVFIENLNSRHLKNGNAVVDASVQVDDVEQLNALMNKIRKQKGVISVDRARK